MSPALAGRFLTTGLPGKPLKFFKIMISYSYWSDMPHPFCSAILIKGGLMQILYCCDPKTLSYSFIIEFS